MDICDVYKLSEYQALEKMSGISFDTDAKRFAFDDLVLDFINNRSRFPYLDELPNSNSEESLREALHIKDNSAKIQDILSFTGRDNIEEANISIND